MAHAPLPLLRRGFGETVRRDAWWVQPVVVFTILTAFVVYATWAAFQNAHYTYGPYLSPFYSPELFGSSPHAWLGPKPAAWPAWLPFSPALLILPFPGLFRFTCYYYRGAYYKAFWADPPACAVGEPRSGYRGESSFPLVLQNVHRYFLYAALVFLVFLSIDAYKAFFGWREYGGKAFEVHIGSLILLVNVVLLAGYTFGCHSLRHLVGGGVDEMSKRPMLFRMWKCATCFNKQHQGWALASLFWVAGTDVYVRLLAMGKIPDIKIF